MTTQNTISPQTKTLAYLRTSTDKQDLNNQKLEILEWSRQKSIKIDDFIQISMSSRKTTKARRIDELVESLESGDVLVVTELSRLGRSTSEVVALVNVLIDKNIRLIVLKQGLDISKHDMSSKIIVTLFALFAELERDLISSRTKEALAAKKQQGIQLGKPTGTIQKSKFDQDQDKIRELLAVGLSVRKIASVLGYSSHFALNTYIKKRNLRA